MENLTHSLIGIVAGDAIARSVRSGIGGLTAESRRAFLVTVSVIGGNLPDADLIVSFGRFTGGDKLGYLLQHRGYTHTIVGCVILALLLYAAAEGVARYRKLTLSRSDRIAIFGVALLGTLLHLGMDSLNSYGVHPFWPFNNEWFYGDSVFIVEPLYWIAAAPMFFLVRTVWARVVLGIALLAALAVLVMSYVTLPAWYIAGIVIVAGLLLFVGKRVSARAAVWSSGVAMIGVTSMFVVVGQAAAHRAEAIDAQTFPSERGLDHVLSPGPANPFCWTVLMVQTGAARYTVRQATLASSPSVVPADHCLGGMATRATGTAPMSAVAAKSSTAIHWQQQFSMPEARLAELAARDCEARELLQFARVPFAAEVDAQTVMGDLRFDDGRDLGFTEIALRGASGCQFSVPWVPPRAALLGLPADIPSNLGGSAGY